MLYQLVFGSPPFGHLKVRPLLCSEFCGVLLFTPYDTRFACLFVCLFVCLTDNMRTRVPVQDRDKLVALMNPELSILIPPLPESVRDPDLEDVLRLCVLRPLPPSLSPSARCPLPREEGPSMRGDRCLNRDYDKRPLVEDLLKHAYLRPQLRGAAPPPPPPPSAPAARTAEPPAAAAAATSMTAEVVRGGARVPAAARQTPSPPPPLAWPQLAEVLRCAVQPRAAAALRRDDCADLPRIAAGVLAGAPLSALLSLPPPVPALSVPAPASERRAAGARRRRVVVDRAPLRERRHGARWLRVRSVPSRRAVGGHPRRRSRRGRRGAYARRARHGEPAARAAGCDRSADGIDRRGARAGRTVRNRGHARSSGRRRRRSVARVDARPRRAGAGDRRGRRVGARRRACVAPAAAPRRARG